MEIEARLELMPTKPCVIILTETHLNETTECATLLGYVLSARRDSIGSPMVALWPSVEGFLNVQFTLEILMSQEESC